MNCARLKGAVKITGDHVEVVDLAKLQDGVIDELARSATFGTEPVKAFARWVIWEIGQALGARPASIHEFYIAAASDEWKTHRPGDEHPLHRLRHRARRPARRQATNAGALIFEIARSEMSYCELPPAEYSAMVIAAAIKEGYFHPLFIQGDHFQVKAAKYKTDPEGAIKEVKDLIKEAIPAGFWNIDIDTSTLVTLEPPTLEEQQ
jgi:fructose-bisphosphate aldolase class II